MDLQERKALQEFCEKGIDADLYMMYYEKYKKIEIDDAQQEEMQDDETVQEETDDNAQQEEENTDKPETTTTTTTTTTTKTKYITTTHLRKHKAPVASQPQHKIYLRPKWSFY